MTDDIEFMIKLKWIKLIPISPWIYKYRVVLWDEFLVGYWTLEERVKKLLPSQGY